MTAKPVQIQPINRFTALWGEQRMGAAPDGHWVQFPEAQFHEQAALFRARELLEAKAKEWQDEICVRVDAMGNENNPKQDCTSDLLALASTLGDQPASGLEARVERLEAALRRTTEDLRAIYGSLYPLVREAEAALGDDAGKAT